jgi:RNA polymerase sigma-70 factor (ECF subfamily)
MCDRLRPDLLRFAFWLGRDRELANDVVQEAMLRAWKAFDTLDEESKAKAWMLTIVKREFARTFSRKRHETVDIDALVSVETDLLAAPEDDRLAEMRAAIFRLEDDYREPLVLQVLMGYSTREIATMMDMQQGAVLTRLFRARTKLRHELGLAPEPEP